MTLAIGAYGPDMGGAARGVSLARERGDALALTGEVVEAASPSWASVRGDRMAATLEGTGELAWFRRSGGGWIAESVIALGAANPCHLAFLDDDTVAVACYGDGAIVVARAGERAPRQRLEGAGSGPLPAQEGPHAHHVLVLADGRILTLDLGADLLHVHKRDASGLLERVSSIALPAGTGPRDLHMLPSGAIALLGEWSCELLVLDAETLQVREAHPLPGATRGSDQASALAVSWDGRFLFAGIRGANRIAVFALDGAEVRPVDSVPSGGDWPRHMIVDGEFLRVANQRSDEVVTFRIPASGIPKEVSRLATPAPTCVVMTTPESLLS